MQAWVRWIQLWLTVLRHLGLNGTQDFLSIRPNRADLQLLLGLTCIELAPLTLPVCNKAAFLTVRRQTLAYCYFTFNTGLQNELTKIWCNLILYKCVLKKRQNRDGPIFLMVIFLGGGWWNYRCFHFLSSTFLYFPNVLQWIDILIKIRKQIVKYLALTWW